MSDYRNLRDALDRGEHEAEMMFGPSSIEYQERERRKLAQEWGDRILFWALIAVGVIAAGELVLRLGFGLRTIL